MITVAILINGQPILLRSATNQMKQNKKGETQYLLDDGQKIYHDQANGAITLAHKMLDSVPVDFSRKRTNFATSGSA